MCRRALGELQAQQGYVFEKGCVVRATRET